MQTQNSISLLVLLAAFNLQIPNIFGETLGLAAPHLTLLQSLILYGKFTNTEKAFNRHGDCSRLIISETFRGMGVGLGWVGMVCRHVPLLLNRTVFGKLIVAEHHLAFQK